MSPEQLECVLWAEVAMEASCDEEDFDPIVVSSSSSQPCDSDLSDPQVVIEENDGIPFPQIVTRRSALRHVYDSDREFKCYWRASMEVPSGGEEVQLLANCWWQSYV